VNILCERSSGSAPDPLDELCFKRRRGPRSLSSIGAGRTVSLLLTGFCIVGLLAGGLYGCATYQPEPLEPAKVAQQFERRSLSNAGLCEYIKANLGAKISAYPPPEWDLGSLTLVGFYYSPDLSVADARVRQADAAIITARAVPNPTVHAGPQYREAISPNFAPWGIGSFSLDLPIETAGKRGYRMAEAERLADAARLAEGETAWAVRSRIRTALLQLLLDFRSRDLAAREEETLALVVTLFTQRVNAGGASRPELSLALSTLEDAKLKSAQASARLSEDRNVLSAALGLPIEALDGAAFTWPMLDSPPDQQSLSAKEIQRLALLNRIDLRRELAQYAAADEALKLEIAKQYPDINITGGYSWEGGENIFELGPSAVLPVFNQNQGPIAEAGARRKEVSAQFLAMQAGIIEQSQATLVRYRGALLALDAARSAADFQAKRLDQARRALAVGESDAVVLAQTQLQDLAARQSVIESLANTQTALGALEDSIQRPLDNGDIGSFTFPAAPRESRLAA
jgi:cobalt-zinc-cadmium efflux system outer membrane protein